MLDMYPFVPPAYVSGSAPSSKPKYSHAHSFALPPSSLHTPPLMANTHASSSRSIAQNPLTPLTLFPAQTTSAGSSSTGKRPKLAKKAHSSSTSKQRGVQASLEGQVDKHRGWQAFFLPPKPLPNVPPCSPVLAASRPKIVEMDEEMHIEGMGGEGDDSDLSRTTSNSSHCPQHHCAMGLPSGFGTEGMQLHQMQMGQARQGQMVGGAAKGNGDKGRDYFGQWAKKRDEWVEDVDVEAMDLDMT